MRTLKLFLLASCLFAPSAALAQIDLDRECPIPYIVSNQQSVAQAYLRAGTEIAESIPALEGLSGAELQLVHSTVRGVIAGEAEQALADVRRAYLCRIRLTVPENKHAHAEALMEYAGTLFSISLPAENWTNFQASLATNRNLGDFRQEPVPALDDVSAENRLTAADLRQAIGNPDFRSRTTTKTSLEVYVIGLRGGVCRGSVRATLALVDGATIGALGAHHTVLEDLLSPQTRLAGFSRVRIDARSIAQSNNAVQVVTSLTSSGDPMEAQRCFTDLESTANVANDGSIDTSDTGSSPQLDEDAPTTDESQSEISG